MSSEKFYSEFAEILEIEPDEISEATELDGDNWDSMAMLEVISLVDELYEAALPGEGLVKCRKAGDVWALVETAITA